MKMKTALNNSQITKTMMNIFLSTINTSFRISNTFKMYQPNTTLTAHHFTKDMPMAIPIISFKLKQLKRWNDEDCRSGKIESHRTFN